MATPGGNNTANRGGPLVWEVDRSANRRVFAQYLVTNKDRKIDVAYLLRNAPTFKGLGTYGQQLFYLLMGACNINIQQIDTLTDLMTAGVSRVAAFRGVMAGRQADDIAASFKNGVATDEGIASGATGFPKVTVASTTNDLAEQPAPPDPWAPPVPETPSPYTLPQLRLALDTSNRGPRRSLDVSASASAANDKKKEAGAGGNDVKDKKADGKGNAKKGGNGKAKSAKKAPDYGDYHYGDNGKPL